MVFLQFTFYALLAANMVISAPATLPHDTNAALAARETYALGIRAEPVVDQLRERLQSLGRSLDITTERKRFDSVRALKFAEEDWRLS